MEKKLIIITGASSGIGEVCARKLSALGHPLLLLARRVEILEGFNLPNTICEKLDVTNFNKFREAVLKAEQKYGPTDLLINGAGIMPLEWYINQDNEDKMKMIDTNIKGVVNGMDAVLPGMVERESGTIINISSTAGRWTADWRNVYNGTKFAVHAITEGVRREIAGKNVRVLLFAPAIVDTNLLLTGKNEEIIKEYEINKKKVNGGITAEEAADLIIYMYSLPQHIAIKEIIVSHTNQKI